MASEEIITGLRNALERGQPIQKAIQSLITAGYNPTEVNQVAREMNTSILHYIPYQESEQEVQKQSPPQKQQIKEGTPSVQANQTNLQTQNNTGFLEESKPKKKMPKALWILIILLVIVLIATTSFIFFGKEILDALFPKA